MYVPKKDKNGVMIGIFSLLDKDERKNPTKANTAKCRLPNIS